MASGVDGVVDRIELDRTDVRRPIRIGSNPTALAAGAGALWVASEEAGTVTRIDLRSGKVVKAIGVGNGPGAIAVGEGAVWVVNRHDGTLSRIDPASNAVSWTVRIGSDPTAVTAGGGAVWVAGGEARTVSRVDPDAPRVLERIAVGSSPVAIASVGRTVWTAVVAPQLSHRGGTLRFVIPRDPPNAIPVDWLDPNSYSYASASMSSLAYDGLVGYPRIGGAGGATLVGALATSAPAPSRDGRTYVFTLRAGVRYSDGRPVRPEDFRASMERFLRVTRDTFPPYYAGILGARRCMAHPARCDLSTGIETDSRARTITIRLNRPDFEFPHKLAIPFAYVVPADTPLRPAGDSLPPGTGPYRFAAWDADSGGRLVRNRYFRSPSPRARPSGFADRIELTARPSRTIDAQLADVQRGVADLAIVASPFTSHVPTKRLEQLSVRSPGRLHSISVAVTEYMFLNVRRRPFDAVGVRRALNYATDRARIIELRGGRELAVPTCQFVPAGFPGHAPYCPYTAAPGPARGWTAPDLDRARRLVAESGRAGERVVVTVDAFRRDAGRYFAGLLDDLGFRASLRVIPDGRYYASISRPPLAGSDRHQRVVVGVRERVELPPALVHLHVACRAAAGEPVPILRSHARQPDRPRGRLPGRGGRPTMGGDRPSRRRPRPRRPAVQPPWRGARIQAGRQRPEPPELVPAARSALGALTAASCRTQQRCSARRGEPSGSCG